MNAKYVLGLGGIRDLYDEPAIHDLLGREDADDTFARIAAGMPPDHPEPELTTVLTALAALRAREAAERRVGS